MSNVVEGQIPVERQGAAALRDEPNREAVGRLVNRVRRPRTGPSAVGRAIADLQAEVKAAGFTDAEIDAELAAYNAERRERGSKA